MITAYKSRCNLATELEVCAVLHTMRCAVCLYEDVPSKRYLFIEPISHVNYSRGEFHFKNCICKDVKKLREEAKMTKKKKKIKNEIFTI